MVELAKTCRSCMKSNVNLVDLFRSVTVDEGYNVLLVHILMITTSIKVSRNDGLPQNICSECVNILQMVAVFRNNVLKTEEQLRKFISIDSPIKQELEEDDLVPIYETTASAAESWVGLLPKVETKNGGNYYKCDKCQKCYTSHKRFLNHVAIHDDSTLNMQLCDVKIESDYADSLDDLIQEPAILDIEADTKHQYKCNECDQTFCKERSLISHRRKHRNINIKNEDSLKFECDYCGKTFSLKPLLKRHLKLHSVDRPFVCTKCSKSYTRQDQLVEHMKRHNKVKTHVCSHCNKGFYQLCNLKDHLRVHTKEAPYLCSECGKGFTNNSNLRQHMIRHSGVKPFSCTFCPKTFTTKAQMVSHIVTHTGAHPHKCDECGARFTKLHSLKKHKFIHLDIKAFACDTCHKRFSCKDHLKRHQRIHTGEKPYRCKYCDRAFTQSNDAVKHMRIHVGQNIYHCTVCNMKFRLMRDLKKHYPTHYITGTKTPTIPVGNGVEAPVMVLNSVEDLPPRKETISESTDGQITITVSSNGYKDGLAGGIIINVAPQNS